MPTNPTIRRFPRALAAALAGSVAIAAMAAVLAPVTTASAQAQPAAGKVRKVVVIFKDGRKLDGEIVSETDSAIKLRVVVAGIKAETEYQRSEIKEIQELDAPKTDPKPQTRPESKPDQKSDPAPAGDKPASKPADGSAEDLRGLEEADELNWGDQKWRITSRAVESEKDGPKVYMISMSGAFGRNVSFTPMEEIVLDMKKYQPDVVVCFYNHDTNNYDFAQNPDAFNDLEIARNISTLFVERLRAGSEFTKAPRVVSWIRRALENAAFMPFTAQEIYYTSDGLHGGIGYLEKKFDGIGDERTREKQYSLLMARAEGLLEEGGHNPLIMRAMCRTDFVLSVKFVDGNPVFLPHEYPKSAEEVLLTDDGKDNRQDILQDLVRQRGNDVLTLDAETALRLQLSKGTADTLDDLMDRMGMPRNYVVIRGRSSQILREWSRAVSNAETQFDKLWQQFREVRVREPGDYAARTQFRGTRIQILKKIKALLARYKEAIDPQRIRGGPDGWINRIDEIIDEIEAQQLADKPERR